MVSNKEHIDRYFNTRIKDLEGYFNKFCSPDEKDYWGVMVSDLYIHLIEKQNDLNEWIEKDELHFYCVKYIYNQRNWSKTSFKKFIHITDKPILNEELDGISITQDEYMTTEEVYEKEMIYIKQKEVLDKAMSILDYHERFIFGEYFMKGKTLRKIGSEVGLSHIAIHRLVHKIKDKLQKIIERTN